MTVALRKADGDIFVDEAGRGQEVTGPTKVDQEMFSNYATPYTPTRNWGSNLQIEYYTNVSSMNQLRTMMFAELIAANNRHLQKQANDPFLDPTEQIQQFGPQDVFVNPAAQAALFVSVAQLANTSVTAEVFQPLSTGQVLPPPFPTGLSFFK